MKLDKVMLVCSEAAEGVENCLVAAGCNVVRVADGTEAVSRILTEMFDAAIIVSTGKKMDPAETVLNLADIRGVMPIIIVTGIGDGGQSAISKKVVAQSVTNVEVVSRERLKDFLQSARSGKS